MLVTGRPTDYTQELADKICEYLAMGESMRKVCARPELPAMSTVFKWLREKKGFSEQYTRAKEEAADAQYEVLEDIGDEAINESKVVDPKSSSAVVQAYKLKADNLKWTMSKMKPKKYGEKIDMTTNGKDLPAPILGYVSSNNSNKEDNGNEEENPGSAGGDVSVENSVHGAILDTPGTV